MGHESKRHPAPRTPVARRVSTHGLANLFRGVTRVSAPREVLAGITLLAIAIPEQLATSQLAGVPAFLAMSAFIAATLAFTLFGSNPIVSVGADSTIAPLFAVAIAHLAVTGSPQYLALVAATAIVTGLLVAGVGLLRLGWMADFLSAPIITGFMAGIGVIIIVHQLPTALGVLGGGETVGARLHAVAGELAHVQGWPLALALGTVALMVIGERINPRWPTALLAVAVATTLTAVLSLNHHGVTELGTVIVGVPTWRLRWLSVHQWGVVAATSITLAIVVISQSAMTSRVSADEIGIAEDLSRDFVGVGVANLAAGLLGTFPVDASPARTTVTRLAGGRTRLPGVVAALVALALSPLAAYAHQIPMAVLAGVLFFIAGRLIKVEQFRAIWRASRAEFVVALISAFGVIVLGVELAVAVAVGLAVVLRTWRSARPHMVELGRRRGTTSWEPMGRHDVEHVDRVLAVFFDEALYFANAGVFRRELHELLAKNPSTKHVVLDAVAMSDIDYTGLQSLTEIVADLAAEHVGVIVARANDTVRHQLANAVDRHVRDLEHFDSVDAAATHAMGH